MFLETLSTKWIAAVASIWIQTSAGASYTFGIYSSILKSSQSYDQSTLDIVSVSKDVGANVGVLAGLLYAFATSHHQRRRGLSGGPWVVLAVGAIQCFLGYFFMWLAVVGLIDKPPVAVMCFFMFLAAHSQTFFGTATVVTAVHNFSDYGGTAVGIMKGFLGLSGAVLIQLYGTICKGNPAAYILILAITPSLLSLLLMPLVRIYHDGSNGDKKHLNGLSALSVITASYLMVIITLQNVFGLTGLEQVAAFVVTLVLLALPLTVASRAQREEKEKLLAMDYSATKRAPLIESDHEAKLKAAGDQASSSGIISCDNGNMNLLQAMRTIDFWLLFVAMICGMGSGLAAINNVRQIGESLRYSTVELNSLVSLWSIWNFSGRFGAGYISDVFLHRKGLPRPLFMAISLATMAIGHLIVAAGFRGNLYIGTIVVGISYGSQWSLMPTITSELFGILHMGTIFYTISVASPVGSYVFSVRVIGYFYDKVASGDDNSCYGTHCFRSSFLIMAAVALFGSLVACMLLCRTRMFYTQVVAKRVNHL